MASSSTASTTKLLQQRLSQYPSSTLACTLEKLWHRINVIEKYSRNAIRPMTMRWLLQTNSYGESAIIKNAEWVRQELCVRLAHRLHDFHRLPFAVIGNPHIKEAYDIHLKTFEKMLKISAIRTPEEKSKLLEVLQEERRAHDRTVEFMGQGVRQLKLVCPDIRLDPFLERFFFFRIGRRIMIDHLAGLENPTPGWAGCVHLNCRPVDIIKDRIQDVRDACRVSYGLAPMVTIGGNLSTEFAFIPDHLALVVTEVLKNALRSTVEFHTLGNSVLGTPEFVPDESQLPEVKVEVYKGKSEIVIKVADKGGGIPPSRQGDIWTFGYSTVQESNYKLAADNPLQTDLIRSDMAGYGFGLPLSRAFARYFRGDIHLQSFFGVGTEVFITLNHIGDLEEAHSSDDRDAEDSYSHQPHSGVHNCDRSKSHHVYYHSGHGGFGTHDSYRGEVGVDRK